MRGIHMTEMPYVGTELEVFSQARNWKRYLRSVTGRYIRGNVLEVGAGIGATTVALQSGSETSWKCLEPDSDLVVRLEDRFKSAKLPVPPQIQSGTVKDLDKSERFHAILYFDVLEHIENDAEELEAASKHLETGGFLIVISPAHQWLFSDFDREIGHFRRYSRASLQEVAPGGLETVILRYLDSAGVLLSSANRWLLKESHPSPAQIKTWDRIVVPVSRGLDPLLGWRVGKSVVGVWSTRRKP